MSTKYKAIVFDLGNVLLPFNYQIIIEKLERVETGLGEKFKVFYMKNYELHRELERGKLPPEKFLKAILGAVGNKVGEQEFCRMYSEIFTVNEELVKVLPRLKKNYKLVLMSNTNAIHQKYGWEKYDFLNEFDKLILSHEVGAVKPEPGIYKAVEAYTSARPEEHFYTDDIPEYVSGALALGWDAVQFTGTDQFLGELDRRNIPH